MNTTTTMTNPSHTNDSTPTLGRPLRTATVTAAALTTALALADAAIRATGGTPAWDDGSGAAPAVAAAMAVHALAYVMFATVLVLAASPIDAGRRSARVIRRLLVGSLAVLGGGFASLTVFHGAGAAPPVAVEAVTGISFVLTFVLATALGAALLRRPATRLPASLLITIPALVALTIGLAAAGSGWAHPGYAEAALYMGLAALAMTTSCGTARAAAAEPRGHAVTASTS